MSKKRSRIEHLRAPFVVTVALAATACGGTVTERSGQPSGGSGGDSSGGTSGGGAPNGGSVSASGGTVAAGGNIGAGGILNPPLPTYDCPAVQPIDGSFCNYVGGTCGYGCSDYYEATCVERGAFGGVWRVVSMPSSCNPPPIICPPTAPFGGSPCFGYAGAVSPRCGYGDCYGIPTDYYECVTTPDGESAWTLTGVSECNPPPPPYDAGPGSGGAPAYDAGAALPPAD